MEAKFAALRDPIFEKRSGIVTGKVDVSTPEEKVEGEEGESDVGIPGFWIQVLGNHNVVGEYIKEGDVDALEALEDIRCAYNEDMTACTITFVFRENEFFKNRELTKVYTVDPDFLDENANIASIEAPTPIEWKEGKNLTVKEIQKKQRSKSGKKKGQVRYVTSTAPTPSFFHFFSNPKEEDEQEEEEEQEEEDEEEKEVIELNYEQDFEIGHALRTTLIPHALGWYTGELCDYDDEDYDGEEDEEEDGDVDEEAVSEDEEEEAAKDKKGKKGAKSSGAGAAAPGGPDAQPECKQS